MGGQMKKADEAALGGLHGILSRVMAAQAGEKVDELDEEGNVTGSYYTATPALLTVCARFLKDNDITCAVEESEGLSDLQEALAKKQKGRGRLASITPISEEMKEQHG